MRTSGMDGWMYNKQSKQVSVRSAAVDGEWLHQAINHKNPEMDIAAATVTASTGKLLSSRKRILFCNV